MTDQKVAGTMSDVEGKVKEGVGKATGDGSLELEGKAKQVQGDLQKGYGDVQDKVSDTLDQAGEQLKKR